MRILAVISAFFLTFPALAQVGADSIAVLQSRSGQFVISKVPRWVAPAFTPQKTAATRILTPDLLAVSAERVKQAVLRELGTTDRWKGKIHILITPADSADQPIKATLESFLNGWMYRLEVPDELEESRLVRGLVQTLLLELANRSAGTRSAEVPLWLSEGLTQKILSEAAEDIVVQPSSPVGVRNDSLSTAGAWIVAAQRGTTKVARRADPLADVRRVLSEHPPITFNELSFWSEEQLKGENWSIYQSCSHLLVSEILALPTGRANLVAMLQQSSEYWNWQTAFLKAFQRNFRSLLDVEKWWAVCLAKFTGRDQWQALPRSAGLAKLDEILRTPARLPHRTNELPVRTVLTLGELIREVDFPQQKQILQRMVGQLLMLRIRLPPDLMTLVDAYRQFLQTYLSEREQAGFSAVRRGQPSASVRLLVSGALEQLEKLEKERAALLENESRRSLVRRQEP